MGFWDVIYGITPDVSTVKRAGDATYATVTKSIEVVRVNGLQKLPEYWADGGKRAQILHFTTTLAKNAGKYAVYEGFKHFPGVTVAHKLITDTMREVKQDNGGIQVMHEKMERLEKDMRKSTLQLENLSQNWNLTSQIAIGGGSEKTNDIINDFMKNEFVGNHMFRDLMVPNIARVEVKRE